MDIQPTAFSPLLVDSSKIQSSTDSYAQSFIHYQNLSLAFEHILKNHTSSLEPSPSLHFIHSTSDPDTLLLSYQNLQFKIPFQSLPLTLQSQITTQSSLFLSLDEVLSLLAQSKPPSAPLELSSLSQTLHRFSQSSTPPQSLLTQLSSQWPHDLSGLASFISQTRHSLSHLGASFGLGYESYLSQHTQPNTQDLSHFLQMQPGVDLNTVTSQQILFESQQMIHWKGDLSPGLPLELYMGYQQPDSHSSSLLPWPHPQNLASPHAFGWIRLSLCLPHLGHLIILAHQYHGLDTVFVNLFSEPDTHALIHRIYQDSFSSVLSHVIFHLEPLSSLGDFNETP